MNAPIGKLLKFRPRQSPDDNGPGVDEDAGPERPVTMLRVRRERMRPEVGSRALGEIAKRLTDDTGLDIGNYLNWGALLATVASPDKFNLDLDNLLKDYTDEQIIKAANNITHLTVTSKPAYCLAVEREIYRRKLFS